MGAIATNVGATLDVNPFSGSSITTTNGNTNGILGGYATYGNRSTWAVAPSTPGGAITGLSSYSVYNTSTNVFAPGAAANVDLQASNSTALTTQTINSLRYNTAATNTLTIASGNLLTIGSGGILITANVPNGGIVSNSENPANSELITGGMITGSASGQLDINAASNTALINIGSQVIDNGGATAVVLSANANQHYLTLSNVNNSFSGGFYLNGGGVNAPTGGTAFGTGNVYFGNSVSTGSAGGGIVFGTAANTISTGLLVANNSNNTSNGLISGNGGGIWSLLGTGTQTFAGIIGNYSGGRVANLSLDSGTQIIGNTQVGSSLVIADGGTFQVGNGYWGNFSNANNNVGLVLGGGTFDYFGNYAGASSQTFLGGTFIGGTGTNTTTSLGNAPAIGGSTVIVTNNSGAGALLTLNALTRYTGGTVNFVLPSGAQSAVNGITTSTLNTNGILGGYATVGGTDWAANATNVAGGNIVGLSTLNGYTASTAGTTAPGATANVDFQASNTAGWASQSINSLRFNTAGANTLTNTGTLVITSGGILNTANVGTGNATTISGGTLKGSSGGDLVIFQNNVGATSGLTISSAINDNTTATGLTLSGPGLVTLTGANGFTGGIFLNSGTLNVASSNLTAAGNAMTFNGGTLQASGAITSSKAVSVGVNGGTIDLNGNAVTLSGNITGVTSEGVGAGLYGGFASTGVGLLTVNNSGAAATLQLNGSANNYFGGLTVNGNTTVQAGSSAGTGAFSTGYVTLGSGSGTPKVDLNGRSVAVAGIIGAGTNGVVTSTAGTPTLTLDGVASTSYSGVITGSLGLTLNLNNPTESLTLLNAGNTYSGATLLTSGSMFIGNGTTDGAITGSSITDNTSLTINNLAATMVDSGTIAGTGNLLIAGAGPVTFNNANFGSNTFSGTLTNDGVLNLGTSAMSATIAMNGTNTNPATINYISGSAAGSLTGNMTVTPGTTAVINNSSSSLLTLGTSATTIANGSTATGSTLNLTGTTGALNVGMFNVAGKITGSNANSNLSVVNALATLSNNNTYGGTTSVYAGGHYGSPGDNVIVAGTANALPSSTVVTLGNATAEGTNGGTNLLDLNGNSQTIAGLSSSNDVYDANYVVNGNSDYASVDQVTATTPSSSTLTITPAVGNTYTFGGVLGGGASSKNFGVTMAGAGTQVFSGANTYTGPTQINSGTLSVTGSLASASTVTVGGSTGSGTPTLNGTGTINGNVIVASAGGGAAGTITPGTSSNLYGTMNIGGTISFQTGSVFALNMNDVSSTGELVIGGAATISSGAQISINLGSTPLTGSSYVLAVAASGLNSSTPFTVLGSLPTGYQLVYNGTSLDLNIAAANGQYTLTTTAGSLNVHANGGTTTLSTTIQNTGTGTQDTLNYSNLTATSGTGTVATASGNTTGTALAQGATSSPAATQTYTAGSTAGNDTVGNSASVTNSTTTGTPVATNNGVTINVYSGLSTWAGTGSTGAWGSLSTAFGTNWGANQGSPGVTPGFTGVDTATFGTVSGQPTVAVNLNDAAPNLNKITFNTASTSYTVAQGTGSNSITLSGTTPSINVTAGTHTISAPVILGANTTVAVVSGSQVTISGQVSGTGTGLSLTGAGTTSLTNATGNNYTGGTSVTAGKLFINNTSGSATGSGAVTVSGSSTVLKGRGEIDGAVTLSSGATLFSGSTAAGTGPGTGMKLTSSLAVNGAALTFQLANGTNTATYASPNTTTSYIDLGATGTVSFTGSDTINLVDLSNGGLTLRMQSPYLLISGSSSSVFYGLVVKTTRGAIGLSQNGFQGAVLGVWTGVADNYTAFTFNQFGSDGVTPLAPTNAGNTTGAYIAPYLYLSGGNLEVVPEPSTWALMLGGLGLLIIIQRRRNKLN